MIHFSVFLGCSFMNQKPAVIAVFCVHIVNEIKIHMCVRLPLSPQVRRAALQAAQRRPAPSSRSFSTTPSPPPRQPWGATVCTGRPTTVQTLTPSTRDRTDCNPDFNATLNATLVEGLDPVSRENLKGLWGRPLYTVATFIFIDRPCR